MLEHLRKINDALNRKSMTKKWDWFERENVMNI